MVEIEESEKQIAYENQYKILGHGSANNMKFLSKDLYNWKGIHQDIETFVRKCAIRRKTEESLNNTKNRGISTSHLNEVWELT